ncbi:MAG: hypothetical protein AABZ47_04890 [Planctomycetota bacterium]
MRRSGNFLMAVAAIALHTSCGQVTTCSESADSPIDTRVFLVNFAQRLYATARIREHRPPDDLSGFSDTIPLLPPGGIHRASFRDFMDTGCPGAIDVEVLLYRRLNEDMPIGLDPGEEIIPMPVAAGRIFNLPACCIVPVETYTIVNWEPVDGVYRVKFAQGTAIDEFLDRTNRFPNADNVWGFDGVDLTLAELAPPPAAQTDALQGRVVEVVESDSVSEARGVAGIGVLLRTRYRVRLGDDDLANDPDDGFSDPIDFQITDNLGVFSFERPAGAYRVEFFSDDYVFRPDSIDVESPNSGIEVLAENSSAPSE